ncbi:gamma-glutamyltransferase [Fimbriimonas ginsengisoli]|uniref:Glutathione hydrolase proenzyme n=1 Tax=Fimbriimonas ginsengisoli Gsoil 348 TaxID=661478 RepID=A0A068NUM9_FIMGI|nr:gamma-glutamyltransferase [Fimbriimonas ginsengisoli]AIE85324.1 gamma-glutamyltransferase [Fimbriimonas ginsengisoli Gsoil 348]
MLAVLAILAIADSETVTTRNGVVVCDEPLAAQAGASILRKGGNAVDAAVATALALAVVEPTAGNIGGGGFMLVRMTDGRKVFLDYREEAPRKASRNMYLAPDGSLRNGASTLGPLAAGVPGTVAGMGEASHRFGKLPWRDLVEPAVELAERGFPLSRSQASALEHDADRLTKFDATRQEYFKDGKSYVAGETLRLPQLAETLRRIQKEGAREFYQGHTADLIAIHMRSHGGIIDRTDLAAYHVRIRKPLVGTYRGREVMTSPPPSSGGVAVIEMLNILEGYPRKMSPANRIHVTTEAMRRAFADRSELMGDPDFVRVPVSKLIAKNYAAKFRNEIDPQKASRSVDIKPGRWLPGEHRETTHFSVVDAAGNAVANTYTLNGSFGCADTVEGAGFLLNNEMDDFAAKPGSPNMFGLIQGERNAIAPNKRPLSSMTPTIVLSRGKLEMVLGSPGGPTIINTVLEVFLNRADLGMSPVEAVRAPRFHHQWMPDELTTELLPNDVLDDLRRFGHRLAPTRSQGIANCVFVDPKTGQRTGVADRRYRGSAAASE